MIMPWFNLEQFFFQVQAVWFNLLDWCFLSLSLVSPQSVDDISLIKSNSSGYCVCIQRPGSVSQIRYRTLKECECTVGYNLPAPFDKVFNRPVHSFNPDYSDLPSDCVLISVTHFSVNYADICIRWGLYDSANKFVGWPVCPGFDIAGIVDWAGENAGDLKKGDRVFGATFFGGYSSRVLVPCWQVRRVPQNIPSLSTAAALPAVTCTALHALNLAGFLPQAPLLRNKAVLVHSAAGGVGSMLCCMGKLLGADPVVGVVGRKEKKRELQNLKVMGERAACDVVLLKKDLWKGPLTTLSKGNRDLNSNQKIQEVATLRDRKKGSGSKNGSKQLLSLQNPTEDEDNPNGNPCETQMGLGFFGAIFDANGVETLQSSYDHLAPSGRLIVYGFHTNLPLSNSSEDGQNLLLSPLKWLQILWNMVKPSFLSGMPKFDPMLLTVSSKAVLGFNLSFFANEVELFSSYFDKIYKMLEENSLPLPVEGKTLKSDGKLTVTVLEDVRKAHEMLSSGKSIGKLVIQI